MFVVCPFDALGSTMATFGGQNVGAGRLDRLGRGLRSAVTLGAIYSALILVVLIFFGRDLILLFVNASEVTVIAQYSPEYLKWLQEHLSDLSLFRSSDLPQPASPAHWHGSSQTAS